MVHNRRTNGQTDGWTDGNIWTDGHITVGGQPKMLSISILYSLTRKERHSNSVNFKRYYKFTSNNMANIILVYTLLLFDSPEGLKNKLEKSEKLREHSSYFTRNRATTNA